MAEQLRTLLLKAYDRPIAIQSTWARDHAPLVCAAASLGFITTNVDSTFGRRWRVTMAGMQFTQEGNDE